MNYEPKITKKMLAINANLTADVCCEPDCGTTILVDKNDKVVGQETRCVACTMRMKLNGKVA